MTQPLPSPAEDLHDLLDALCDRPLSADEVHRL